MTKRLPNILTATRALAVPSLILLAYWGARHAFLGLLAFAFLTDWADGFAARHLAATSPAGSRFDSITDLSLYIALPPCIWLLDPDFVLSHLPYIGAAVCSFAIPALMGFIRYHQIPAHHTWSSKAAVVAGAVSICILLATGLTAPFEAAVIVMVLAGMENIIIILILPEWTPDVATALHALRTRHRRHRA